MESEPDNSKKQLPTSPEQVNELKRFFDNICQKRAKLFSEVHPLIAECAEHIEEAFEEAKSNPKSDTAPLTDELPPGRTREQLLLTIGKIAEGPLGSKLIQSVFSSTDSKMGGVIDEHPLIPVIGTVLTKNKKPFLGKKEIKLTEEDELDGPKVIHVDDFREVKVKLTMRKSGYYAAMHPLEVLYLAQSAGLVFTNPQTALAHDQGERGRRVFFVKDGEKKRIVVEPLSKKYYTEQARRRAEGRELSPRRKVIAIKAGVIADISKEVLTEYTSSELDRMGVGEILDTDGDNVQKVLQAVTGANTDQSLVDEIKSQNFFGEWCNDDIRSYTSLACKLQFACDYLRTDSKFDNAQWGKDDCTYLIADLVAAEVGDRLADMASAYDLISNKYGLGGKKVSSLPEEGKKAVLKGRVFLHVARMNRMYDTLQGVVQETSGINGDFNNAFNVYQGGMLHMLDKLANDLNIPQGNRQGFFQEYNNFYENVYRDISDTIESSMLAPIKNDVNNKLRELIEHTEAKEKGKDRIQKAE